MVGKFGNLLTYFLVTIATMGLIHFLSIPEVLLVIASMVVVGTIIGILSLGWTFSGPRSMVGEFLEKSIVITMMFGTLGLNLILIWQ